MGRPRNSDPIPKARAVNTKMMKLPTNNSIDISGVRLASKVVEKDILLLDAQFIEHVDQRCVHHRWTAKIILAILRCWMIFQIVLKQDLVDESCQA
jgi:hypothetical protein